ncbi:MAG: MBL fold metallo-hydrolase [Pseudomonadota bacterium]
MMGMAQSDGGVTVTGATAGEASPFSTDHAPIPGAVERLEPGLRAITAPNAGPMTFTGTRSYLVGVGAVALIDPGPEDRAHFDALFAALDTGERISHIFVTHSHVDHAPLARAVAVATGAKIYAFGPHGTGMRPAMAALVAAAAGDLGGGEGADRAFDPDVSLADGDVVAGAGWQITALHTPGHLSNHLCFALAGDGIAPGGVLSGDHVMGWATTLVSPPDGDLSAFMASLRRMATRKDRVYFPGHGAPVGAPGKLIAHILAHRAGREAQIVEALGDGAASAPTLAARIYREVDPRLLPAATRNVLAHLLDLTERGVAGPLGNLSVDAPFRLVG